jgi:RNA polymerase sigma-70 factor (ECF subfamily)
MRLSTTPEHIQEQVCPQLSEGTSDAQLLDRFVRRHEQAAFAALMCRHGPMVLGVCRRVLHHEQDAEDAFQATFLVLAKKAASISKRESVGGWLYTTAYRLALRAKDRAARRGRVQKPLTDPLIDARDLDPADAAASREFLRVLDAALHDIPEKYRTAFVLCHLEGRTYAEAAEHLGCPLGTVQSRTGRALVWLRALLAQRGWVAPLAESLDRHVSSLAAVSPVLVNATIHSALLLSLGKALGREVPDSVLGLMDEAVGQVARGGRRYLSVLAVAALLTGGALAWLLWSFQPGQDSGTSDPCHHAPLVQQKE